MLDQTFRIRIIVNDPPAGAVWAMQRGSDALVPPVRTSAREVVFEAEVRAVHNKAGALDFRGPVVQGPLGKRFVYVNSGTYAGHAGSTWSRRAKISLMGITASQVAAMAAHPSRCLEVHFAGTAKDGGPAAASVPLPEGWMEKE